MLDAGLHRLALVTARIIKGDCREVLLCLEADSFDSAVTSPPYWRQRDYGVESQIGLEETPGEYVDAVAGALDLCRRVLKPTGSLWLNLGEKWASGGNGGGGKLMSRSREEAWAHSRQSRGWRKPPPGYKDKDIVGAAWAVAMRLREMGWYLRQTIIWDKAVATEPPRTDRPSVSHEYIFLLTKDADSAVRNPGEAWFNSSVWRVRPNSNFQGHPACMNPEIVRRCIVSSSSEGGHVLDPFGGSGTTGMVADQVGRHSTMIELNPSYGDLAARRLRDESPLFADIS